jgi:hypothetical protein
MSRWVFEPVVGLQVGLSEGPLFGFRIVNMRNERGVHLFFWKWAALLTWVRSPLVLSSGIYCPYCNDFHVGQVVE